MARQSWSNTTSLWLAAWRRISRRCRRAAAKLGRLRQAGLDCFNALSRFGAHRRRSAARNRRAWQARRQEASSDQVVSALGAGSSMVYTVQIKAITTPASAGGVLQGPFWPGLAASVFGRLSPKPIRIGNRVIAVRHRDVVEVLGRDLDFRIAPINAARIDQVNGPFILGMDRGDHNQLERHALYAALATVDLPAIRGAAADAADSFLGEAADSIDVVGGYARRVAGRTAARLFGVTGPDEVTFLEVARAVFAHTFLNIGGDKAIEARAVEASALMRAWLTTEIARRRSDGALGDDLTGALMRRNELDDDAVRRLLGGMLVGAVDTTASSVAKIVVVFSRDKRLMTSARRDAGDIGRTRAWCFEALRRWPHNPIVLRQAAADTTLAGAKTPAGAQVIAWTQAAMQDAAAFPDPKQSRPDRDVAAYLHFGGGLHPCAGRAINDVQIPMLVGKLLARGIRSVGAVKWAGPFPDHLAVMLERPR
jgi:cytochrome P450